MGVDREFDEFQAEFRRMDDHQGENKLLDRRITLNPDGTVPVGPYSPFPAPGSLPTKPKLPCFPGLGDQTSQLVIVKDIQVSSLDSRFLAHIAIGYLALGQVAFLSRLGEVPQLVSRANQSQEELTNETRELAEAIIGTRDVIVLSEAIHYRKYPTPQYRLSNLSAGGIFQDSSAMRSEFLALAK